MDALLSLSSDFASLVSQLQDSPHNPVLKQAVVTRLPEMMVLAKKNPLALFHLAQVYPPSSSQYKQMMRRAALQGCTNAMLAVCTSLLKSGSKGDVLSAAYYMKLIEASNDSYILEKSRSLLEDHPELVVAMVA